MNEAPDPSQRLHALLADAWAWEMREFPERATWAGYPGQNHRWSDRSRAAIERRKGDVAKQLADAKAIARAELSPADQLNLDLFVHETATSLEEYRWPGECLAITQMDGVHQDPAQVLSLMGGASARGLEDVVARLEALPLLFEQSTALLREGLAKRVTPPRICLRDVKRQIENLCGKDAEKSPLLAAFSKAPAAQEARKREAAALFAQKIVPALRALAEFVEKTYLPGARAETAWSALPDGEAWYAFKVREQTTTSLSPKEIHAIGLEEVKRIRARMDAIVREAGFGGDFAKYCDHLWMEKMH